MSLRAFDNLLDRERKLLVSIDRKSVNKKMFHSNWFNEENLRTGSIDVFTLWSKFEQKKISSWNQTDKSHDSMKKFVSIFSGDRSTSVSTFAAVAVRSLDRIRSSFYAAFFTITKRWESLCSKCSTLRTVVITDRRLSTWRMTTAMMTTMRSTVSAKTKKQNRFWSLLIVKREKKMFFCLLIERWWSWIG